MKILVKKSELELLVKTIAHSELTTLEAWKHLYYFGRFVHARQKTMNWVAKQQYFYEKGQNDFVLLHFREELNNL